MYRRRKTDQFGIDVLVPSGGHESDGLQREIFEESSRIEGERRR